MKSVTACIFFLLSMVAVGQSRPLTPSDTDSKIRFKIKNLGLTVNGDFKGLAGSIQYDAAKPLETTINVSVDATTINTGIRARDSHLCKQEYFDVKTYTRIFFQSSKVVNSRVKFYGPNVDHPKKNTSCIV